MTRSIRAAIVLVGVAAIVGACSSPAAPATAAAGSSSAIDISGFAFKTTALDVTKGSTVTWSNKDGTTHTVSSGTPPTKDGTFDGQVVAGGSFSVTFNDPGTFSYFCSIHNSMTGTITVK